MTDKEITISKLQVFKHYGFKGWGGIIDFYEVDFDAFRQGVHNCTDELIEAINNDASPQQLKSIMKPYITHLRHLQIVETEEREYVSQIYYELSKVVAVDVAFALNRVIYGWLLTALTTNPFKKREMPDSMNADKVVIDKCISCGYEMKTNIFNRANDNDMEVTMHAIVACKVCGELNIVFITEDGEVAHSHDYYIVEQFSDNWNIEQAQQRMNQVKQWRNL